uniref:Ubiquitin carboxyl-terminal hydrolase 13-like n=1 Tax=Diabrotica virgifera virgifera TaxID=50390 RepID=A0A6P7GJM9_DIAVI
MDILTSHLSKVKVPTVNDKVYKDECVYSFDNPESPTGLYVSLATFIGLGRDHVEKYAKTYDALFLHLKREKFEVSKRQILIYGTLVNKVHIMYISQSL